MARDTTKRGIFKGQATFRIRYDSFCRTEKRRYLSVIKKTPWPLVRKRTIPTERPSPTFADRGVSRGQLGGSPTVVNLQFSRPEPLLFFQVALHLFGNDSNKSKFDSGGNQEEIEFW
jgi:hypothetical protein